MPDPKTRKDPFTAFQFVVEVDGKIMGLFKSVSGLANETEIDDYQEGGDVKATRKIIGQTKWSNIVLRRGFASKELWEARMKFAKGGTITRISGSIKQLGPDRKTVVTWTFNKGIICKWSGPEYDATKNEVSVETIEIAHEGIEIS
jgi:phage tail-like protein